MSHGFELKIPVTLEDDRIHVAKTALEGAIRVMEAVGLSEMQVNELLRSVTVVPDNYDESDDPSWSLADDDSEDEDRVMYSWEIDQEFRQTRTSKKLERLRRRADLFAENDNKANFDKLTDVVKEAVPVMAEAQNWYVTKCAEVGVPLVFSREAWMDGASDEELDQEDSFLFYERSDGASGFPDYALTHWARLAESLGRADEIRSVIEQMASLELEIGDHCRESLLAAFRSANLKAVVDAYVNSLKQDTLMSRVELLHDLQRVTESHVDEGILCDWLEQMEQAGLVECFKKSNRWHVLKL